MKIATWFLVTKDFLPGFRVFWRSLLQHNPRELFGEVVIQTENPKQFLSCEQSEFRFWPYRPDRYAKWPVFASYVTPCYTKLEALACADYDQITVMDCDMICTGSLEDALSLDVPFAAVGLRDDNPRGRFNGGFWKVRQPLIGNSSAIGEIEVMVRAGLLFDQSEQSALVCYLEKHQVKPHLLPLRYNLQTGWAKNEKLRPYYLAERHDCRILHYTSRLGKPWLRNQGFGWRKRFHPLWARAKAGEKITSADVEAIEVEK